MMSRETPSMSVCAPSAAASSLSCVVAGHGALDRDALVVALERDAR